MLPLPVVGVASLAIYSQTLGGAGRSNDFYFSFDSDIFLQAKTWRMAAGQAFYSLSIGLAPLITYGSYTPRGVNIIASSAAIVATNSFVSILVGLMVFSDVFTFGIVPETGSQLSFTAFAAVFGALAAGRAISLLFLAVFTSCTGGSAVVLGIPSVLNFTSAGFCN